MTIKITFRYTKEVWSFLNKTFTKIAISFFILILLVGLLCSDFVTTIQILTLILLIYLGFGIKTLLIIKKQKYFIKNGKECPGIIKDIKVKDGHSGLSNTWENSYELVYLVVEYMNPYTNKLEQFVTESVNGNPFTYLSSLDVTVYVLPNGEAWATDFKRIKKLSNFVEYKENTKNKKEIVSEEKHRFGFIIFFIIFFIIIWLMLS